MALQRLEARQLNFASLEMKVWKMSLSLLCSKVRWLITMMLGLCGVVLLVFSVIAVTCPISRKMSLKNGQSYMVLSAAHNSIFVGHVSFKNAVRIDRIIVATFEGSPRWGFLWDDKGRVGGFDFTSERVRPSGVHERWGILSGTAGESLGWYFEVPGFGVSRTDADDGYFPLGNVRPVFQENSAVRSQIKVHGAILCIFGIAFILPVAYLKALDIKRQRNISWCKCKCRYDLRGSVESERCPECGTPIDDATRQRIQTMSQTPTAPY